LEELKHERQAYLRMMKLWSTVVPFFAWCSRMPWGRAGLATSLAGKRTLEEHLKQHMPIDMPALERTLSGGLDRIHACGLAHGDIEMRNIVVDDDGEGGLEAKFIDFGSSSFLDDDRSNALHVRQEQERDRVYLRNMLTTAEAWTAK
jgi:serine/threonine protein kinase